MFDCRVPETEVGTGIKDWLRPESEGTFEINVSSGGGRNSFHRGMGKCPANSSSSSCSSISRFSAVNFSSSLKSSISLYFPSCSLLRELYLRRIFLTQEPQVIIRPMISALAKLVQYSCNKLKPLIH
jgi:hypothetical protein